MIKKFQYISSTLVSFLLVSCMLNAGEVNNDIEPWMAGAARACINAQISIGNTFFDPSTGLPSDKNLQLVEFVRSLKEEFYFISIKTSPVFPDAPLCTCLINIETNEVFRAFYHGPKKYSKDVELIRLDLLKGVSEEELNALIKDQKVIRMPLSSLNLSGKSEIGNRNQKSRGYEIKGSGK